MLTYFRYYFMGGLIYCLVFCINRRKSIIKEMDAKPADFTGSLVAYNLGFLGVLIAAVVMFWPCVFVGELLHAISGKGDRS